MLGVLPSNTAMSANEAADGLIAYNAMLDAWRNDRLMCYALQEETLTLVNGDAAYNIGPSVSADLNTTRPVSIEAAWVVDSAISYEVMPMDEAEYDAIPVKTTQSDWPNRFLYRASMPMGVITVYPVPNASRSMTLLTRVPLTAFSATTDTVSLPPGWEEAIATNGAIALAPEYQVGVPAEVAKMARESLKAIKRTNAQPLKADSGLIGLVGRPVAGNITTGE
jgi:hypothetical protein